MQRYDWREPIRKEIKKCEKKGDMCLLIAGVSFCCLIVFAFVILPYLPLVKEVEISSLVQFLIATLFGLIFMIFFFMQFVYYYTALQLEEEYLSP